jgi:hypothetical protein
VQAVPITVSGTDALGQPFKERTTTVMVNCHGCKYQSKHYVPKNSLVNLEVPRPEANSKARQIQGRVVWVQRPRTVRELFQIGLEFDTAANVWGIAFPPEDWAAPPAEAAGETVAAPATPAVVPSASGPAAAVPSAPAVPARPAHEPPPQTNFYASEDANGGVPEFTIAPAAPGPAGKVPAPPAAKPIATEMIPAPTKSSVPPPPAAQTPVVQLPAARTPAAKINPSPAPPFAPIAAAPPIVAAPPKPPAPPVSGAPSSSTNATSSPAAPAGASGDHKIHVVPAPPAADQQAVLARQMARMVTEAKENLDKTLRHDAALAVSEKMSAVRAQLDAQLHDAVDKAIKEQMARVSDTALKSVTQQATERAAAIVEEARRSNEATAASLDDKVREAVHSAVTNAASEAAKRAAEQTTSMHLSQSVAEAVDRALRDREAATPSLSILNSPEAAEQHLENWRRNLENTAGTIRSQALERTEEDATAARDRWNAEFEKTLQSAQERISARAGEISQAAVQQAEQDVAKRAEGLRASLDQAIADAASRIEAAGSGLQQERQRAEEAKAQLFEATQTALQRTQQQLDEYLKSQYQEVSLRADQLIQERAKQIEPTLEASAKKVIERASTDLDQKLAPKLDQVQRALGDLAAAETRAGEAHTHIKNHLQYAADEIARSQASLTSQTQAATDQLGRAAEAHAKTVADEAARSQAALNSHAQATAEQINKAAEAHSQTVADQVAQLNKTADTHNKNIAEQFAQLEATANLHVQGAAGQINEIQAGALTQVKHAAEELTLLQTDIRQQLQEATDRADTIQDTIREQAQIASEESIQAALARVREETAKVPEQLDATRREIVTKIEEELGQRGSEIQHQHYDAMLKTAEWYQKKAQTSMQASLEKSVEQSTTTLRDRAAEVSSLLASELDHYRRTYVEHSTAQIEDAAKEVIGREREKMSETAQMVTAGFSDQVYRATTDSLKRFESAAESTLEKSRSDMEFNRETSLAEFQKMLDEQMTSGVDQAKQFLQSHLVPMMEQWDAQREAEKKQWMDQLQRSTQESIESYKTRLEAASNQWLLASATSLGQHSQSVLDTVAKAAEKRIRDTCAEVLGGVGDTLKQRLMGLSDAYKTDDSDLPLPGGGAGHGGHAGHKK